MQRHLAEGVRRAGQARVVAADDRFHAVEHRLLEPVALDVLARDLEHGAVHRRVVVPRGDHEVRPLDQAVVVHLVVVHQGPAGRLGHADALVAVDAGHGPRVLAQDLRPLEQLLDLLDEWSVSMSRA